MGQSWKGEQIDMGLAVRALFHPGERATVRELAAYTCYDPVKKRWVKPISSQRISQIEHRALRKIRSALHRDKELRDQLGDFGLRV